MSFCTNCGKQLPEGVTVCDCLNQQSSVPVTPVAPTAPVAPAVPFTNEVPDTAPVTNVLPNEAPVAQAPAASAESPFVVPMGNNGFYGGMPAGNGAPMGIPAVPVNNNGDSDEDYLNATKDCKIINILGIVMFLAGIVSILFINEWVAAIIFFIGEFFVLFPKMRVQKLCKTKNPTADRKTQRKIEKEAVKKIKAKNKHFIIASVIAYVCLAGLIVSFIVPVPLIREEKKDSDGMSFVYDPEESTTEVADETVTEPEVVVPAGPYYPTVDEFVDAYCTKAKECLGLDLFSTCNYYENGDTAAIRFNAGSLDYMEISCTLEDGRIRSMNVYFYINYLSITISGSSSELIAMCKTMTLFVPYIAVYFQKPDLRMDFDSYWNFVTEVDNLANANYVYSASIEMEGCIFSVFGTSTCDYYQCEVTLPQC